MIGMIPTSSVVTISNTSPSIVTWPNHSLAVNAPVFFRTTGALNAGLVAAVPATGVSVSPNTYISNPKLYYVKTIVTPDAFTVSEIQGGSAINTSSAGSGIHTAFANAAVPAGYVGEIIYKTVEINSGVPVSPTGTQSTWNSIDLTAGIWDVFQTVGFYGPAGTTNFTDWHATVGYNVSGGAGQLTITSPYGGINAARISTNYSNGVVMPGGIQRFVLTGNTTITGAGSCGYTGGIPVIYGTLCAIRAG